MMRAIRTAQKCIAEKRLAVEGMVTKTIGFNDSQAVFECLSSSSPDQMKVVIRP